MLGVTSILAVAGIALLILMRIGIARQEHARSLAARPRGLCAAFTRRLLDLHAASPDSADQGRNQNEGTASARSKKSVTL